VRDILRAVDELGDLARAASGPLAGRLRIGVIPTVAPYLLPRLIKVLSGQRFPGLDLRPREAVTGRLLDDLAQGRLDTAVVALPVSEPSLVERPLFDEEFVLVRPQEDAHKPVPDPDSCAPCGCCCWRRGTVSAIRRCRFASCRPRSRAR
jgi:LysR family transcriptional regulator, hydrogen peroxide-inducible genes activator